MKDKRMQQMLSEAIAARSRSPRRPTICVGGMTRSSAVGCVTRVSRTEQFYSAPGHKLLEGLPLHQSRLLTTKVAEFWREQGIVPDLKTSRRRECHAASDAATQNHRVRCLASALFGPDKRRIAGIRSACASGKIEAVASKGGCKIGKNPRGYRHDELPSAGPL